MRAECKSPHGAGDTATAGETQATPDRSTRDPGEIFAAAHRAVQHGRYSLAEHFGRWALHELTILQDGVA